MASITRENEKTGQRLGVKGQFLIATPAMQDPRFERSVIFMIEHDRQSAMGVIINKIFDEISFIDLLEQLDIEYSQDLTQYKVLVGGPVDIGRGFVLHSPDVELSDTVVYEENDLAVTTSLDMLAKIANGKGPAKNIFALGYAGWGAGQLDQELKDNGWIVVPATPDILFETPAHQRWERALQLAGISVAQFSTASGSA